MCTHRDVRRSRTRRRGTRPDRLRPGRLLSKEPRAHRHDTAREGLLAQRSLVDAAIARLESRGGR